MACGVLQMECVMESKPEALCQLGQKSKLTWFRFIVEVPALSFRINSSLIKPEGLYQLCHSTDSPLCNGKPEALKVSRSGTRKKQMEGILPTQWSADEHLHESYPPGGLPRAGQVGL